MQNVILMCLLLTGSVSLPQGNNHFNSIIKQLNLDESKCDINLDLSKVLSDNRQETLVVIPEMKEEGEDYFEMNSHVLIVDTVTGKIKQHFFESPKENGWVSDAIMLTEILLDTTAYKLSNSVFAFGIKTVFTSSSQPNPYSYTSLSLYIKEGDSLKKVLDNLVVAEYSGEVNINLNACYAKIKKEEKKLTLRDSATNGYYDILVTNTISNSIFETNSNGDCEDVKKSRAIETSILKYNDTEYKPQ